MLINYLRGVQALRLTVCDIFGLKFEKKRKKVGIFGQKGPKSIYTRTKIYAYVYIYMYIHI